MSCCLLFISFQHAHPSGRSNLFNSPPPVAAMPKSGGSGCHLPPQRAAPYGGAALASPVPSCSRSMSKQNTNQVHFRSHGDDISADGITAAFKRRVWIQTKTFRDDHEPSESDKRIFKWPATFYLCRRRPKRMKRNLNQSTSGR